jgi:hypothetical protein
MKIHREIESIKSGNGSAGEFTFLEICEHYEVFFRKNSDQTNEMKTVRNVTDYIYNTYTYKVQYVELTFLIFIIIAFAIFLFGDRTGEERNQAIQRLGEFYCPILLVFLELC